jgi:hypothetical protein
MKATELNWEYGNYPVELDKQVRVTQCSEPIDGLRVVIFEDRQRFDSFRVAPLTEFLERYGQMEVTKIGDTRP